MSKHYQFKEGRTFSQALNEARKVLPKLSDFPEAQTKIQYLIDCLRYYINLLEDGNTTALETGSDIRKVLHELSDEIGDIADMLAPDTPEVKEILEEFDYYDELA